MANPNTYQTFQENHRQQVYGTESGGVDSSSDDMDEEEMRAAGEHLYGGNDQESESSLSDYQPSSNVRQIYQ